MATVYPAAAARQPFAPIEGSRLQNLTSLKNRQNAVQMSQPIKRKATAVFEDSENVDPLFSFSPKRSKSSDAKSASFVLTKAPQSHSIESRVISPLKTRPTIKTRSPAPFLSSVPLTAPAGRSPTRKRVGILSRRKTASPFTRIDPPKFSIGTEAPFSIAAALSGTIPSYSERQHTPGPLSKQPEQKDGWFFEIHEDTAEEMMTNLMEHSTCTLDISSDEETDARHRDDRGKENVPPLDDISQSHSRLPRRKLDECAIDIDRSPLVALDAEDFYAAGCCASDVVIVVADEEEKPEPVTQKGKAIDVDEIMKVLAPVKAALLEPLEKAEEGFEVWESESAKGDE